MDYIEAHQDLGIGWLWISSARGKVNPNVGEMVDSGGGLVGSMSGKTPSLP
jgi:hypothetical protein